MFESFKLWIAANYVDVLFGIAGAWFFPALLQAIVHPPEGSKAFAAIGALAAWGFDAEKFARKLRDVLAKRPRGIARMDVMAGAMTIGLLLAALMGSACGSWFRAHPEVAEAGDLVLHAADTGCGVVALLHDDAADAVCLAVHELDALETHLKSAEAAEADAPLAIVSKSGRVRRLRVKAPHVKRARASVAVARLEASP